MTHETLLPADEIDLAATLDGGQAFRWHAEGDGYRGVIARSVVRLSEADGGVLVRHIAGDVPSPDAVARYLCLDFDLPAFRARYADDPGLGPALRAHPGLRVLRQDTWECLCAYICSANNSVSQIKRNVAAIVTTAGEQIGPGDRDFAFPDAAAVAGLGEPRLRALGLGFRARYVVPAARAVASGAWDLAALSDMPYEMAKGALVGLQGVGPKIADCVLAFSLGKGEAFPVDIWVRRAMLERYRLPGTTRDDGIIACARQRFGLDASYANQYLFHHQRTAAEA